MIEKLNKMLSVCFALLLIATATVTGTLAFETWTAQEYAESTTDKIKVSLVQEQRKYDADGNVCGLEHFADNKVLVPLVSSAQYDGNNFDRYGMPMAEGYVDQMVRVKNEGTGAVYARVIVAIPAALDDASEAGNNALHWNLGNRFMPGGSFGPKKDTNAAFSDITWKFCEKTTVNGVESNIYIFTYNTALAGGETMHAAAFVGFYLDSHVDVVNGHILLDGVDTGFTDDEVTIPVVAQAMQAYGFSSAADAFAGMSNNPWNK